MHGNRNPMDERDREIVASRMAKFNERQSPRVGDFVRFSDGTLRRISYHWTDDAGWDGGVQTSDYGSFYLGDGYVSMSGSLFPCIPTDELVPTGGVREGSVWIFHHDIARAHNGVDTTAEFRVYSIDREPNR